MRARAGRASGADDSLTWVQEYMPQFHVQSGGSVTRKRRWSSTSSIRYQAKIARVFKGTVPEEYVWVLSAQATAEQAAGYSVYHNLYERLKKAFGKRIPPAQLGLYRAALFAMYNAVQSGYPVEGVIEKFSNPKTGGLDRQLLEEIARYFGLLRRATQGEHQQATAGQHRAAGS